MERWDERNSKLRTTAYELDDIDGGVVFHNAYVLPFYHFTVITNTCLISRGCHESTYSKCNCKQQ
jgi:hypothetical protein